MNFLSAEWNHLLLANYSVSPEVLKDLVPEKTSLDDFDGHTFVSLVAFMFNKTRVLGMPVPGHIDFEEVNLRFYIKPDHDPSIRAVCFIKEIVPKKAIPLIANNLFNENYVALPMDHRNEETAHSYSWQTDRHNAFSVTLNGELAYPAPRSVGEFITEHYWGYAKGSNGTLEYKVEHPQWTCCEVSDYEINVDFASTYGPQYAFLNDMTPYNVQYARGSDVTVSNPKKI